MRVHLIKKQTIEDYCQEQPRSKSSFEHWVSILQLSDWSIPADIMKTYASADLLGNGSNRVVFNIGGNHYRMICKYAFGAKMIHLFVCWIGTHAEYDKVCAKNEQYSINYY